VTNAVNEDILKDKFAEGSLNTTSVIRIESHPVVELKVSVLHTCL